MNIGQVLRTVTVEPVEEPIPGRHRIVPAETVPAEPATTGTLQEHRDREPVPAIREEATI
ncbi:hypothetical protein [Actinomycetospora termitidis]|uniref:Uncharacterized protein n=1 Tax=Actinomycetospora termitidis TaxID=3053470 RepID=A0ABT7MGB5_9PSEU|nr:hypothetical protein [Actinomycetospora sp. Odt1-22]MDL5158912.1 hypothetical protein [Actinomycetospora sp. Odt1-22]